MGRNPWESLTLEVMKPYSSHSKAYKVFNKITLCGEETVHVLFDKTNFLTERNLVS